MSLEAYKRTLNLNELLRKKSFFLFGPRWVGKSHLIRSSLPEARVYNLLDSQVFQDLSRRPAQIREQYLAHPVPLICIDEIQKLPALLDEAQLLIEEHGVRFLFTGSSIRKLRRGGANLLAGRAWEARLFPLTSPEIDNFDLNPHLLFGGLPAVLRSDSPWEELRAYTGSYLQEEIVAESAARSIESFVRFLDLAATKVAEEINLASLASDVGVSAKTLANYFQILEDTLIGFQLTPFSKTKIRKASARQKFYLFDLGVTNSLLGIKELPEKTSLFGRAFEQFIILELRAYLSYQRLDHPLHFWRSTTGLEVDALVGQELAIEIKATNSITERDLKGLRALREEKLFKHYIAVSRDPVERELDGIRIFPWRTFLEKLWAGKMVG